MKIAIVAPSPVPFTIGGAEKVWWGLQDYINNHTSHQCELFKIPTRENNFWDLIESYYTFYKLDLSYFDMIITTKYPAWMVRHQNHTVYLQHHLRGLFDTYHFCNEPLELPERFKTGLVDEILQRLQNERPTEKDIDDVFEALRALKIEQNRYDSYVFKFPGPFIRSLIHFFDAYALAPERIKRYYSISKNVQLRDEYFPNNVSVGVIYHPSRIESFECKGYEYLFTASRLDSPKRIEILVEAMRYVPYNVQLKIAGTGPEEARLKQLAGGDPRIEFIGYASEKKLIDLYASALCVLYIPYDEDYGLITIEGMKSRKPILTATDSGGSLEFVKDNLTGFVVDPDPQKIAERINYCIEHPEEARKMGENGYLAVQEITWQNLAYRLLEGDGVRQQKRRKILALATYSCYPPRGGGQHRLYNLYSLLAKHYDVTICSIIESNKVYQNLTLKNGLRQICIPQSREHAEAQWKAERKLGVNLYDVAMIDCVEFSKEYVETVQRLMKQSDIVIFSHPYLFSLSKYLDDGTIVIHESHNVEYLLKTPYVRNPEYLEKIRAIEKNACIHTHVTFTTSEEDRSHLIRLYGLDPERVFVVPNGVDIDQVPVIRDDERQRQKESVKIAQFPTVLFVGSWHPPNLEALRFIVNDLGKKCQGCLFIIIGSVKDYYIQEYGPLPKNVLAFGAVDEDEKYELYKLADIAINPMFSGSGTNLKMLDYMSAGIPVVTTPVGARGIPVVNYEHAIVCPPEQMAEKIQELISDNQLRERLRSNARNLVENGFSWDSIARQMEKHLRDLIDQEC